MSPLIIEGTAFFSKSLMFLVLLFRGIVADPDRVKSEKLSWLF